MAKETFYFTHDYNARNDDKILELRAKYGAEGYGIFWMIVETMAENSNGGSNSLLIGGLSLGFGVKVELLKEVFKYCIEIGLFYKKKNFFYSKRLLTHKGFRAELSKNGTLGAEKRWSKNREAMAGLSGGYGDPNAKERKGKENKENKGISFNENKDAVLFKDGSSQLLGKSQKLRLSKEDIKPEEIFKGYIT